MNRVVLDSSALLTLLFAEPGKETVADRLPGSLLSTVNLSETVSKMIDRGMALGEAEIAVAGLSCDVVVFDESLAFLSCQLRRQTKPFGLSLGDRACLALGLHTGYPVMTADRDWEKCDTGIEIIRVR